MQISIIQFIMKLANMHVPDVTRRLVFFYSSTLQVQNAVSELAQQLIPPHIYLDDMWFKDLVSDHVIRLIHLEIKLHSVLKHISALAHNGYKRFRDLSVILSCVCVSIRFVTELCITLKHFTHTDMYESWRTMSFRKTPCSLELISLAYQP